MAQPLKLTVLEVREYISDFPSQNYLIDGEEFSDTKVMLCMDLAVEEYNQLPPFTHHTLEMFPSKSVLLQGTLWKLFDGRAALAARNTMSFADGGLQLPIEERTDLYSNLAAKFGQQFKDGATRLKVNLNMEAGFGSVRSDYSNFPLW